jgi:quercetin dioxygenase-like cupin family protein
MSLGSGHYTLAAGEGDAFWIIGDLMTIKAGRAQTGNAFTVGEFLSRPGSGPPPHIHHVEDEAFYVLEGALTGFCGDQQWEASPGSFIWLPRGIVHGFTVASDAPAKVLFITAPAGFEGWVAEVAEPAQSLTLPPAPTAAPNIEKFVAAGHKIGHEYVPRSPRGWRSGR